MLCSGKMEACLLEGLRSTELMLSMCVRAESIVTGFSSDLTALLQVLHAA